MGGIPCGDNSAGSNFTGPVVCLEGVAVRLGSNGWGCIV